MEDLLCIGRHWYLPPNFNTTSGHLSDDSSNGSRVAREEKSIVSVARELQVTVVVLLVVSEEKLRVRSGVVVQGEKEEDK